MFLYATVIVMTVFSTIISAVFRGGVNRGLLPQAADYEKAANFLKHLMFLYCTTFILYDKVLFFFSLPRGGKFLNTALMTIIII